MSGLGETEREMRDKQKIKVVNKGKLMGSDKKEEKDKREGREQMERGREEKTQ